MTKDEISYRQEWIRKSIHLSSLWMPLAYHSLLSREAMLWCIGIVGACVICTEIGRMYIPQLERVFSTVFGSILRHHERNQRNLSGAGYVLIGAFLTVLLFSKPVAIAALSIVVVADAAAALVGRKFGSIPLAGKSLQGSLTFFAVALLITFLVATEYTQDTVFLMVGAVASLLATITELYSKRLFIDDNLSIPMVYGLTLLACGM